MQDRTPQSLQQIMIAVMAVLTERLGSPTGIKVEYQADGVNVFIPNPTSLSQPKPHQPAVSQVNLSQEMARLRSALVGYDGAGTKELLLSAGLQRRDIQYLSNRLRGMGYRTEIWAEKALVAGQPNRYLFDEAGCGKIFVKGRGRGAPVSLDTVVGEGVNVSAQEPPLEEVLLHGLQKAGGDRTGNSLEETKLGTGAASQSTPAVARSIEDVADLGGNGVSSDDTAPDLASVEEPNRYGVVQEALAATFVQRTTPNGGSSQKNKKGFRGYRGKGSAAEAEMDFFAHLGGRGRKAQGKKV